VALQVRHRRVDDGLTRTVRAGSGVWAGKVHEAPSAPRPAIPVHPFLIQRVASPPGRAELGSTRWATERTKLEASSPGGAVRGQDESSDGRVAHQW